MTYFVRNKSQKTAKIAEIQTGRGFDVVVILDRKEGVKYPLKVYKKQYQYMRGWSRKKINEFGDMVTTLRYIEGIVSGQIPV